MTYPINDPYFRVEVLSKTERPNLLSYLAMHQDYSEKATYDDYDKFAQIPENELGERLVRNCIKYNHWGILEHSSITFNVIGFPHNVMVQARTHRVGISFDVQSQRYTGDRIVKLAILLCSKSKGDKFGKDVMDAINKVFYLRPFGTYQDRQGNNYEYNITKWQRDVNSVIRSCLEYLERIEEGYSPEHARDFLIPNIRQDFVVTFNARSLLHFCDLRLPKDAQLEIRTLAQMLFEQFKEWMTECSEFYEKHRYEKNKLAP